MNKIHKFNLLLLFACVVSCSDYLDVVPEGTPRLENAFSSRTPAYRYLSTCYSYLTSHDNGAAVDITGSDEVWFNLNATTPQISLDGIRYAYGLQTTQSPLWNFWPRFYMAIRDCNIFLENIGTVPEIPDAERKQWIAEVKVLKAYYHFLLMRQYGPVPVVRKNLDVSDDISMVRVERNKVDDVVDYAVSLIDEAIPDLVYRVAAPSEELGRITTPIACTIKATILLTAASKLFNGNELMTTLKNHDGTQLIDSEFKVEKWAKAVAACKQAIEACDSAGVKLYTFPGDRQNTLTPTIMTRMSLRGAFTERWNEEIIWGDTKANVSGLQNLAIPKLWFNWLDIAGMRQYFGPPLKIAEQFYTNNGVPLREDKTWDYSTRYEIRTATQAENLCIRQGEQTSRLHFEREPRFYAWMSFDNGVWYGQGVYNDADPSKMLYMSAKFGQPNNWSDYQGSMTGYMVKKYVHYQTVQTAATTLTNTWYVWPWYRLADLYLMYAEALNEAEDTQANRDLAVEYLNKIRARAGIPSVQDSWSDLYVLPEYIDKWKVQSKLRDIIRQERLNELCFERKRFWDLRRWMTAAEVYQTPIQGWSTRQSDALNYYNPQIIYQQVFNLRDYFWPIPTDEITGNPNLVQNIGW